MFTKYCSINKEDSFLEIKYLFIIMPAPTKDMYVNLATNSYRGTPPIESLSKTVWLLFTVELELARAK